MVTPPPSFLESVHQPSAFYPSQTLKSEKTPLIATPSSPVNCKNVVKETAYKTMWVVGGAALFLAATTYTQENIPLNLFLCGVGACTGVFVDICWSNCSMKKRTLKNLALMAIPWGLVQGGLRGACYLNEVPQTCSWAANFTAALMSSVTVDTCVILNKLCEVRFKSKPEPTMQNL